jgi:hypothetical protein
MGSTYGLEVAVYSATTYGGIARGSASYWESKETAVSDAMALTDLQDLREALIDNDIGAKPSLILTAVNQETRYYNLTGSPATQMIGDADKSPGLGGRLTFAGMPFAGLPDFTDTVLLMLDMSPGKWANIIHRPFDVHDQGRSGDSDVYMITFGGNLIDKNPKLDGKLTGLTA